MDEGFSSREGQGWAEASNVFKVKESCFYSVLDVGYKGKGWIKNGTKVADVLGGVYYGAINGEGEILG